MVRARSGILEMGGRKLPEQETIGTQRVDEGEHLLLCRDDVEPNSHPARVKLTQDHLILDNHLSSQTMAVG
jgi:hypothetical protein